MRPIALLTTTLRTIALRTITGTAVLAGVALALGAAAGTAPAYADGLGSGHLSVGRGARCALRDVGVTGEHVLRTGSLPKAFDDVRARPGVDGVAALCDAVHDNS
jgi:hypothetical protein